MFIAHTSIRAQYLEYYESTLLDKASVLAHGASQMLEKRQELSDTSSIETALDLVFSSGTGPENIHYALYNGDGTTRPSLPYEVTFGPHTEWQDTLIRAWHPTGTDRGHAVMIGVDYAPFLSFSRNLESALFKSMFSGCAMMAASYLLFTVLTNLRRPKREQPNETEDSSEKPENFSELLKVQLISIPVFTLLALPFLFLYSRTQGVLKTGALIVGGALLAIALAHLCRLLLWLLRWYFQKPISGYSAQTLQFFMFLLVFLSLFCYSVQNGYQTQIELSSLDELRFTSMFASLAYEQNGETPSLSENVEVLVVNNDAGNFRVVGRTDELNHCADLLDSAWNEKSATAGLRGGYLYGVSAVVNDNLDVTALICARQPYSILRNEFRTRSVDFLLGMTATVLALVFLFIELNKLLEVVNTPLIVKESSLKYALSIRSLMFLVCMSQYIPQFFFVLIVGDIYRKNPIPWLSPDLAATLPLTLALFVVVFGRNITARFINLDYRDKMLLGCAVGTVGFLLMATVDTLFIFLVLLIITYWGISLTYNGLWDFVVYAIEFDYAELQGLRQATLGGDFLGYTSGAVIGAMLYDKFGLFAALSLSAAILVLLGALIQHLIPDIPDEEEIPDDFTFLTFFQSKNVLLYTFLAILPYSVAPYFIDQFSPLYADSIQMSPGAASWTSLLQVIFLAYITPPIVGRFFSNVKQSTVAIFGNILSAAALALFALMPGIPTLYIASAMIGVSIGTNSNIAGFYELDEALSYKNSENYFYSVISIGGQIGTILFTLAHTASPNGHSVMAISIPIAAASIIYFFILKRSRTSTEISNPNEVKQ